MDTLESGRRMRCPTEGVSVRRPASPKLSGFPTEGVPVEMPAAGIAGQVGKQGDGPSGGI